MGNKIGKEDSQEDSQFYERVSFHMNILVCGNYIEKNLKADLEHIMPVGRHEGIKCKTKGIHKTISEWKYYIFTKDKEIGENTLDFIQASIIINRDYKNLILFYSGLKEFTIEDLLKFYDGKLENYHPHILIIEGKNEKIELPRLKKFNKNFIRICKEENRIEQLINTIEIASYYNQLGDEIGYPKKFTDQSLLEKDNYLITKYLFTINILLCGRPGAGKSTLINNILGKEKSLAKLGSNTITTNIVKYIHEKYPLVLYDSPGFETEKNIEAVQKLITEKNQTLNEEKNRIHCIFYVLNRKNERTFIKKEYEFLANLIKQNMDVFIVATHAESKENSENYIEAVKIQILQNANDNEKIEDLKQYIHPVELKNENNYKRFGIKELFNSIYGRYEKEKILIEINQKNIKKIKSQFIKDIQSKDTLKKKLEALSLRVKANFKLLAASLGTAHDVKGTTMLSTSVIKIISNIYNRKIATKDCQNIITDCGYTNEMASNDDLQRTIEKGFASIFYFNGPASKEVDYIANHLIEKFNGDIDDDGNFYKFLNNFRISINNAIDSLININDD